MKLRDFNKKSHPSSNTSAKKIVINNDAAEAKYNADISELTAKLHFYQNIESERDNAVSKFNAIEDTLKSERIKFQNNIETIQALEQEIRNLHITVERLPALEESLRTVKGDKAVTQSALDTMTKRAMEQSKELSFIKPQLESLKNELGEATKKTSEAVSRKQSAEAEFEAISNKNKELKSFTDETSKINKELIEENKTLRDWANYKDVENRGLINQLDELKSVETNLQEIMGEMEIKDSKITSSNNSLEGEVSTQQKIITNMGKTLDDMKKELIYLIKVNNEYKKELSKPTYTSMASIASQEGFVMPNGKENIRTHNLGNYKPTMLKFKTKEEIKNGR